MYSRFITLKVKNEMIREFPYAFEKEILPILRKQKGFLDELLLVAPDKKEIVTISMWEKKEFAEIYNLEFYPEIVKILNKYVETVPVVKEFEIQYATFPWFEKFMAVTA